MADTVYVPVLLISIVYIVPVKSALGGARLSVKVSIAACYAYLFTTSTVLSNRLFIYHHQNCGLRVLICSCMRKVEPFFSVNSSPSQASSTMITICEQKAAIFFQLQTF